MSNAIKQFEDNRWSTKDQSLTTRHARAIEMIKEGSVLDIGCGDGLFLDMLKKKGIKGIGVDISSVAVKKCKLKGIDVVIHDVSNMSLPFPDASFNCVVLLDVLEHNFYPDSILKEAARVSNNYVVISVPNFNSLPARIQTIFGRVPENNKFNKGHCYWFNYKELSKVILKANLQIVQDSSHTFWEGKKIIGSIMKALNKLFPSVFALSFIYKLKKK